MSDLEVTRLRTAIPAPTLSVGLIIPTLNAGQRFAQCLTAITTQSFQPSRLLVVDSDSNDGTAELAVIHGFEVIHIARSQFNHGATRQLAVEHLAECDILIFLTQDAILSSDDSLLCLIRAFRDESIAVAYGRQVPHIGATPIESHARIFSYGDTDLYKDLAYASIHGSNVFFCSNSFAAYRRSSLKQIGGFNPTLILGEDMEFAARAIRAGLTNYYCASATVRHSHDYTFSQTFRRYFDIGVFDAENAWMREEFGSHAGKGSRFVASEVSYLWRHAPVQLPRAFLQTCAKFIGYRLGRAYSVLPRRVVRHLSLQSHHWVHDEISTK